MAIRVCVFDAYGTLFDVGAAARRAAEEPGRAAFAAVAGRLAETWREKQLAYTWLRAAAGQHTDFWAVTEAALSYAMEAEGLAEDHELRSRLLALYRELDAYAEVPDMLAELRAAGRATAILSNANPAMLEAAVASAGLATAFDALLSVESVGRFKPAPEVYALVGRRFGVAAGEVLFVSSNGWDAAAAAGFGFRTLWVNRAGLPMDRLPFRPDRVERDLRAVPAIAAAP